MNHYEIDQSGKVENTAVDTVICISNSKTYTIKLKAISKKNLQNYFRKTGQPRNFILLCFSALLSIAINQLSKESDIVVDTEYVGKNIIIKKLLIKMGTKYIDCIKFGFIGKKSPAHNKAYATYKKLLKANLIITEENILEKIKKIEAYKKLKNA